MGEIEDNIKRMAKGNTPESFGWKWIIGGVLGILLFMFISSCWVQVGTNSTGIVLRFGEHVRTVGPGLHFKWPMGIEEIEIVETEKQHKVEFGFRTVRSGVNTQYSENNYENESLMLTGDLNVVDVQWTVQYRISDPQDYLFEVRNPRDTLRYMSQAIMREVVGDRTVSEVLTVGRTKLAKRVKEKLRNLCKEYNIGIRVAQVIPQDITPPNEVQPSFNEVNEAQQEKERMINQAKAQKNKEIPKARGEADRKIQQAEGYAINRVNRAKGEVARFEEVYAEYTKAPKVTRRRIFIETLSEVLPKVDRKVVVDGEATDVVPIMPSNGLKGLMKGATSN